MIEDDDEFRDDMKARARGTTEYKSKGDVMEEWGMRKETESVDEISHRHSRRGNVRRNENRRQKITMK